MHHGKQGFPWIVAHRGAMAEAPENTRAAFDRALQCRADGIEFDVRLTKDRVPVICHDASLEKINGDNRLISMLGYEDLSRIDWGGWFSPRFSGERIMTLDMALAEYSSRTRLFIEIKAAWPADHQLDADLAVMVTRRICALVSENHLQNIFVLSFETDMLNAAHTGNPGLSYVLNLDNVEFFENELSKVHARLYGCCLEYRQLSYGVTASLHRRNLKSMTYSCNTPEEVKHAERMSADVIMTDHPAAVC